MALTINSSEITFFMGAGASAPFGIPTMTKMTEIFGNQLKKEEKIIFDSLLSKMKNIQTQVDIEAVFSLIEKLLQENIKNEDPLFYYWKQKNKITENTFPYEKLRSIKTKLQDELRKACVLKDTNQSKVFQIYTNFFNTISDGFTNTLQQEPLRHDRSWTIFTTNYDLCLETVWRDKYEIDVYTGFKYSGKKFSPDYFLYYYKGELLDRSTHDIITRIVKLHGSINWLKNRETNKVEEKEFTLSASKRIGRGFYNDEVIMYPLIEKELYLTPYIEMFYCLNKELETKRVCLVIGYSFRDPIIRNIFIKKFLNGFNKKVILVDPHANEIIHTFFYNFKENFYPIEQHFGNNDYRKVNEDIKDSLKEI
jgi:NAD-dependent SIR2 family protein deacetylase